MNSLFYCKKGEHLLSIWWFAVIVIVASGIVFGTLLFYSDYADVRYLESESLADKIVRCLDEDLPDDFFDKTLDLLKYCNLNDKSFGRGSEFFLKISDNEDNLYVLGNSGFDENCKIKRSIIKADNFPECVERSFVVYDEKGNEHLLNLVAGSNNKGRTIHV